MPLSPRQIHLDFHTSPDIQDIGMNFDRKRFQQTLTDAHVTSVTMFAKCHHGLCYYPTEIGTRHPGLSFDLLGEMMGAAHEVGIRAPIYLTAGWSCLDAQKHPEWRCKNSDGSFAAMNFDFTKSGDTPRPDASWIHLCLNGPYAEHIYDLIREINKRYAQVDGLFIDIVFINHTCYCEACLEGMAHMGLNPDIYTEAAEYYNKRRSIFMRTCREILFEMHPNATIFFNSGGASPYLPQFHHGSTHYEIEDLPSAWGGYDKMPLNARFFVNSGKSYLGMTGKFHTEWGEIGGYKSREALRYETAAMAAYGARCSIGDHMHPDGALDPETYASIGYAYEYAKRLEPYCFDVKPTADLGICLSGDAASDEGLVKILLETHNDFGIVHDGNFSDYHTVIFPDSAGQSGKNANNADFALTPENSAALEAYMEGGGRVLFTGESLLCNDRFLLDPGVTYAGMYGYEKDFVTVSKRIGEGMVMAPILCYLGAVRVTPSDGEVLAELSLPYFNRTYGRYNGHRNAPYDRSKGSFPAAAIKGNVAYIAHNICRMYYTHGSALHRQYFKNVLNLLYDSKPLAVDLPSAARATLSKQPELKRYCLNLLYAPTVKRGCVEVIDDLPEQRDIPVCVKVRETIMHVYMPFEGGGEGTLIAFNRDDAGGVMFTVPRLRSHALVVLDYE